MNDVMDRLRAANPLARLDPAPPARRRRRNRPLVLALAATVALAGGLGGANPLRIHSRQRSARTGNVFETAYADGVIKALDTSTGKVETNRMDPETQREFEAVDRNASIGQPGLDPVPAIRRLLAQGKLEHDGSTTFNGRKVERLVGSDEVQVEYLVDARTYAPVRLATSATKIGRPVNHYRITFELYEVLPLTPANEALLRIPD